MDSNTICQPSPAKKMKCYFLDYVQLLMIGLAGWWTRTPSASPLQPKKWNATFWITFNFWWLAGLVNGLKPHPPPLSSQRNEMLIFVLCSTSNDQPGLSMDLNPIHHLSPAKKWNAHILIMFNFWWLAGLVNGLKPHLPPLSSQKNEMLVFRLRSLLMICLADWWTWTPSATPLQPIKWNPHFWITSNFWWLAGLVDGLKPHPPPLFSQKMKSSFLDYVQLLMINQAGQWTRTPSASPLQPIKWNAHIFIMFNFWWSARLVNGLKTHLPPPLQPIKWNASFWIVFTSDDQTGW